MFPERAALCTDRGYFAGQQFGEVARTHGVAGRRALARGLSSRTISFEGKEEEGAIPAVIDLRNEHRTPDGGAELVKSDTAGARNIEELSGIQLVVAQKFVRASVQLIGARLHHHVHLRAGIEAH